MYNKIKLKTNLTPIELQVIQLHTSHLLISCGPPETEKKKDGGFFMSTPPRSHIPVAINMKNPKICDIRKRRIGAVFSLTRQEF